MKRKNLLAKKHLYFALLAAGIATPAMAGSGTINTLATFSLPATHVGPGPDGGVILSGTTLYGTTDDLGGNYCGTVFSVPMSGGTPTTLATFNGTNGMYPQQAGVILSGNTLYGEAMEGGAGGSGTIFSVPINGNGTTGAVTTLATFNGTNGSAPQGGLILSGNTLYGTTQIGGSGSSYGTVFSVPKTGGSITTLATFDGNYYGSRPQGLILSGNTLYGVANKGGAFGNGTVFSVSTTGTNFKLLAEFDGTNGDASANGVLTCGLVLSGTNLIGTAGGGGANNDGTIFSVPVNGDGFTDAVTTLATFNNDNGRNPTDHLVFSADGNTLYGTTVYGGSMGAGTVFSVPVGGGNITTLASFTGLGTIGTGPTGGLLLSGGTLYGTTGTGAVNDNGTVYSLTPATTTPTTYTLAASITGSRVAYGRITQGQTGNLTATINNTGGNGTDNLAYDTLTITGANGIFMTPGTGNIASGGNGTATGTFIASTLGLNTFNPSVGNATNATLGNAATNQGNTNASVLVDALVEHVNAASITDTGNASTTPTAFYRQNNSWGGDNLGNVTVTKQAPGSYIPAYVNNINGGSGTSVGTLKINVSGDDNKFGADTSVILLGFQNVSHLGTGSGSLATIEGALTTAGIEWRDYTGANNDWPTMTSGVDPLTGTSMFEQVADYDIELAFAPNTLTSSQSYFDFNFTDQLGTAGDVVNIAVVPEPATMSLLAVGSFGLLARRRRRKAA